MPRECTNRPTYSRANLAPSGVLSDSESESAGPVLTSKQAPLRTRHKSTSSNEEVEKNGSEPVAGPSTTSTLKATADVNSDNEDEDDEEEEEV